MGAQQFECVVSAPMFRRAMAAISKDECRYYLNGVYVEPCEAGGVILVSTDGRRMIVIRDRKGYAPNGPGIVSLNKDMTRALSAKSWNLPSWMGALTGKGPKARFLAVRGSRAAVVETTLSTEGEVDHGELLAMADTPGPLVGAYQWVGALIDGTYPDWRKVVGKPAIGKPTGFVNMDLVAPISSALEGATPDGRIGPKGVRLVPTEGDTDNSRPIFVMPLDSQVEGFGIVMPLRDHGYSAKPAVLPQWLDRGLAEEAA